MIVQLALPASPGHPFSEEAAAAMLGQGFVLQLPGGGQIEARIVRAEVRGAGSAILLSLDAPPELEAMLQAEELIENDPREPGSKAAPGAWLN